MQDMATAMPGNAQEIDLDTVASDRLKNVVGAWPPDVLAGINDPNLAAEYRPFRVEDVTEPIKGGPRLAVKDLSLVWTYNFGDVKRTDSVKRDFVVKNVGDKDLKISASTPAAAARRRRSATSRSTAPATCRRRSHSSRARRSFTVEFDARLAHEQGSREVHPDLLERRHEGGLRRRRARADARDALPHRRAPRGRRDRSAFDDAKKAGGAGATK
ncbi:MAG: hypothetical protein U0470_09885 [Anaerolineae bacterium]